MATEITCIVPDSSDSDQRIDSVGGAWGTKSELLVIADIEAGAEYFVEVDGDLVDVHIDERDGHQYLRTDPDKTTANNLLSLPTCP
jgi:hypothetical protein